MRWRPSLVVILSLVAIFCLSTFGAAESLNIAVPADPDTFDPNRSVAAATAEIAFNIFEGLVKATPDGEITGALASDWDVDETKTKYTFYLRDAKFHDGSLVRPRDVISALNRARNPQIGQRAAEFSLIEDIWAEDQSVVIQLSEPNGAFLYTLAEFAAAIYPEGADGLATQPIGTGPYRLTEWRPNQYLKLERFADHWSGQMQYYEEVYFRIIPDENSMVLNLRSGEIDLIPRMEPSVYHQVENDPNIKVIAGPMNLVQIMAVNNKRPPFDDARVRSALAMAINRSDIILGAAWGFGDPLFSGISPAMDVFYNDDLQDVNSYDPEAARELLRVAGAEDLSFTLTLPSDYPLHVQAGEIAAQQWEQIGIDVEIELMEWGMWLERVYNQRDYDVSIIGLAGRLDPHAILVRYQTGNSRNFFNFSNSEYDQLISAGLTAEGEERAAIYREAQRILAEETAGLFIMDPQQLAAMDQDIQGWKHYPVYVVDAASLYK